MIQQNGIENNLPYGKHFGDELLVIDHGEGVWLWDSAGNKYLDFGAGIAVNALGYGRDDFARAVAEQTKKLVHISNVFATEPAITLGRLLVGSGPFHAVHFGNSGTEANETALKFARAWSLRTKGEGNYKFLSFTGAFHGRSYGALAVTPNAKYQDPFKPMLPGAVVAEFNNCADLEAKLDDSFAAVIIEPIQGEGGLKVMTAEFARALNTLCKKHKVLIIADEVQTGMGRTGTLYASESVGLKPDIITLAKPLGGGLPLSATLIPKEVNDAIHFGEHGTTFGGGPVCASLGLIVWNEINKPGFLESVRNKADCLTGLLMELKKEFSFLGEIRGRGLLQGIEVNIDPENPAAATAHIIAEARENGLLILRSGSNVLRVAPALIISEEELGTGIDILRNIFKTI